ncbi:MetQ/NlpA family ABC transporter substrate-binding protein [Irregularibacter muris]|uniref:MetQ/NlpA family ABC transporter substrate-binding protein n=1 Tax=Irregularibacter muris TaxID=1796619 RepID=A0AAE3HJH7_9FIRM|nr:ABC transporter substrate-binding protein [Irregularibacter muris]MCR1899858.1 MetQ/NlpA family ABC transporter substrate-binding protein [Irregularibacter muris]
MKKIIIVLIALLLLSGCATQQIQGEDPSLNLKVGLMPAVDSAPIFVAEEKGYFKELGLNMDIEVYTNAMNRQSALQTGELDGTITDLIAFIDNVHNDFGIKMVTATDGSFPFLVSQNFEDGGTKKVGMMEVSVTNFLSDELLGNRIKMEKVFIPEIPARLEMVKNNQLDMAIIPEPMASMGELDGLEKKVFESKDTYTPDAMVFTDKALKEKDEAISLFIQGYNRAVEDIQKDDSFAREILIEKLKLKPEIKDKIILPTYHRTRIHDQAYMDKVIHWVEKTQGIDIDIPYESLFEGKYVK